MLANSQSKGKSPFSMLFNASANTHLYYDWSVISTIDSWYQRMTILAFTHIDVYIQSLPLPVMIFIHFTAFQFGIKVLSTMLRIYIYIYFFSTSKPVNSAYIYFLSLCVMNGSIHTSFCVSVYVVCVCTCTHPHRHVWTHTHTHTLKARGWCPLSSSVSLNFIIWDRVPY